MDDESKRVLAYLTEIEEAAEDVLSTKQQVVNVSFMRFITAKVKLEAVRKSDGSKRGTLAGKLTACS